MSSRPWLGLALLILGVLSCSKTPGGGTESGDPDQLIQEGWGFFEAGEYDSAYLSFLEATNLAPQRGDAWDGLGWVSLVLYDLGTAHSAFLQAIALSPEALSAWAGLAIGDSDPIPDPSIYQVSIDSVLATSIAAATHVLTQNPNYEFPHDPRVNATLLQLVKARALCAAHRFYEALLTVQELDPNFDVDVTTPEGRSQLIAYIAQWISQVTGGWL